MVTNGATTATLYHHEHPWADYDASGNVLARYLYAPGVDRLLARWSPGEDTRWILRDHLNSIVGVADHGGNLLSETRYSAFGEITMQTGAADAGRFGFAGRDYDAESELTWNRNRFYDSAAKRFMGVDPLGLEAGDDNFYRYVGNKPTGSVDPYGTAAALELAKLLCLAYTAYSITKTVYETFYVPVTIAASAMEQGASAVPGDYKPPDPPSPPGTADPIDTACTLLSMSGA